MTQIKICGITDVETADLCRRLGADYIGLVFADSPRQISPERAMLITHHLLSQPRRPKLVGVFVNAPAREVNRIAEYCRLDRVQLSGDEDDDYCRQIEKPLIRALRIDQETSVEEIEARLASGPASGVHLVDARIEGRYGGSGECFNWTLLRGLNSALPVMVAGGLNPENVTELIKGYRPWGVDVSSGVESHSHKDPAKIMAFVRAVREADARMRGANNAAR